jgi:hypothetical protein
MTFTFKQKNLTSVIMTSLSTAILALVASVASADPVPQQMIDSYAQSCSENAVHIPFPHGESDLVGNPKLKSYCKCFGTKFAARAMKVTNPTEKMSADSLQKTINEERDMRNSCRLENGLQLIKK